MDNIQLLLQESAKLFNHLSSNSKSGGRDEFIEEVNKRLDIRGDIIQSLQQSGFIVDPQNKIHATLIELDKGIRERLYTVMQEIKQDMKDLQNSKKNEKQYMNPYASVQVMDGMYYDKKK